MPVNVNVLFTSVGRRVELLRAFSRAYRELRITGNIVALDVDPLAPALRMADRPYLVPRLDDPAFIPTLVDIVRKECVAAVFPLIDPDIPCLAAHRRELEACGARLAVVPADAAAIAGDKWLTKEFFERLGLETPRTWLPMQCDGEALPYPVIVKPRMGSASQHVYKAENEAQLRFFVGYVPDPIVQTFIPGAEITNDVVCDFDGRLLSIVSRQRIRVQGGEVLIGKTIFDQRIVDDCARIAESLPAFGPITVQCMMSGDRHLFTEINARFGGGAPLGFAAGANAPKWLLASLAGIEVDIPPIGEYQRGLCISRFNESMFIDEADCAAFGRHSV